MSLEHSDFSIGVEFWTETGRWRCTDVGSRIICAIKLDGDPRAVPSATRALISFTLRLYLPTHRPALAPTRRQSLPGPGRRRRTVAVDNGKLPVFPLEEMKTLTGGKGVQIMKLEEHEYLSAVTTFDGERLLLEGKTRTGKPASLVLSGAALIRYQLHRARKGYDMEKISVVTRLAPE